MYTTNSIESYNRLLRKNTKSKVFPSNDVLYKSLYLVTMDISEKRTMIL
nr:transposase [Terrisporobacter sp.]